MVSSQLHYTKVNRFMPFLLAEILNFQGSTHRIGVGSFSHLIIIVITSPKSQTYTTVFSNFVFISQLLYIIHYRQLQQLIYIYDLFLCHLILPPL